MVAGLEMITVMECFPSVEIDFWGSTVHQTIRGAATWDMLKCESDLRNHLVYTDGGGSSQGAQDGGC